MFFQCFFKLTMTHLMYVYACMHRSSYQSSPSISFSGYPLPISYSGPPLSYLIAAIRLCMFVPSYVNSCIHMSTMSMFSNARSHLASQRLFRVRCHGFVWAGGCARRRDRLAMPGLHGHYEFRCWPYRHLVALVVRCHRPALSSIPNTRWNCPNFRRIASTCATNPRLC